jgi:signal transduction histidine kinase
VTRHLDPDRVPVPLLVVDRAGGVVANAPFRAALGDVRSARELSDRFEIVVRDIVLPADDAPWFRVVRHAVDEDQIWFDRAAAARWRFRVVGTTGDEGGVLVLDDLSRHESRLTGVARAASRLVFETKLGAAASALCGKLAALAGADAIAVFVPTRDANGLRPLASSVPDLAARALNLASRAARTGIPCTGPTFDRDARPSHTGLQSLAAIPIKSGRSSASVLVAAWRQEWTPNGRELLALGELGSLFAFAIARAGDTTEQTDRDTLDQVRRSALAITELGSMHHLLEQLAEQACVLVGAQRAAIRFTGDDEVADDTAVVRDAGWDPRPLLESLASRDLGAGKGPFECELATASSLGTRLQHDGSTIGSLCVFDDDGGFGIGAETALALFRSHAAQLVAHARELELVRKAQRRRAQLYDELAATIAHDMRTPIASMLLQLESLMKYGARDDERVAVPIRELRRARESTRAISRMVDDLFDTARIELRRITLDLRRVSLGEYVTELAARLEPTLGKDRVTIEASPDVPFVLVDPFRLDEIMTNLLDNAAKHSPPDAPIIIRVEGDGDGDGAIVSIEDRGAGIAPEEVPHVFDRFFQTKNGGAKRSGLGLGLYISKGLAEAHGGRIWVDSLPGEGSRFRVWFPAETATPIILERTIADKPQAP